MLIPSSRTSYHHTRGLPTVLTLVLQITGHKGPYRNVFITKQWGMGMSWSSI